LYDKTVSGSISWNIGFSKDLYCSFQNHAIYLRSSRDADGEPLEIIELKNSSDEVIDSFDDTVIADSIFDIDGVANYYGLMMNLRNTARRQALGADKALDDILSDLDDEFG
jgi:hypothetical protein